MKNLSDLLDYDSSSTEHVNFIADAGSNNISFGNGDGAAESLSVDGGSGNDTFLSGSAADPSLQNWPGAVTLVGGSGNDSLLIQDNDDPQPTDYQLSQNQLSVTGTGSIFRFDSTLEILRLDETDAACRTDVTSVSPTMAVNIFGDGGNDAFFIGAGDLDSHNIVRLTVSGGSGSDSIELDDHADLWSSTETELYQLNTNELDKGAVTVDYLGFESQQLDASTAGSPLVNSGETVNLNTTSGIPTTIVGCFNRFCVINVGFTDLTPIDCAGDSDNGRRGWSEHQ